MKQPQYFVKRREGGYSPNIRKTELFDGYTMLRWENMGMVCLSESIGIAAYLLWTTYYGNTQPTKKIHLFKQKYNTS